MTNKILQGSEEWKAARQSKIGASEIYTLVHHYCKRELEALGIQLPKELPFRTIQELFLKISFGAQLTEIDPIFTEFGNGMEVYVAHRLAQELSDVGIERSKEFLTNPEVHPLAACSPDGYVKLPGSPFATDETVKIEDFDKTCKIDYHWGAGALEIKTANFFAAFSADQGAKLQYIFQHQFQMMVMGLQWGIIAVLMPKEKEFDELLFKGKILGWLESNVYPVTGFEPIDQYYDLYHYIYPALPAFQALIMKALNAFQADLDSYSAGRQECFPRNSEDLNGLQREKKMWAQLWPEHYGTKVLSEEDELNGLFNERYKCQEAKMFADQDFDKITNEIYQKVKALGFDKYCEITGTENRMSWIKNGQVRFYKLKGK